MLLARSLTSRMISRLMKGVRMKKQNHALKYLRNGGVNRGQPFKVRKKSGVMGVKGIFFFSSFRRRNGTQVLKGS